MASAAEAPDGRSLGARPADGSGHFQKDGLNDRDTVSESPPSPTTDGQGRFEPHSERPANFALYTRRLWIRGLERVNRDHLEALNNPLHMRYSEQRRRKHTGETQWAYICSASKDLWLLDLQWAYICSASKDLWLLDLQLHYSPSVGTMSCHLDHNNKVADLGIMILPDVSHKGLGTEAWGAVMRYWLDNDYKVEAGCHEDNYPMRDLCGNNGMVYEGMRERHFINDDGTRSALVMYGRVP